VLNPWRAEFAEAQFHGSEMTSGIANHNRIHHINPLLRLTPHAEQF
jgi:hypothetical protein